MWLWLDCVSCGHRRPVLVVHLQIALGMDAGLDCVRAAATCTACGKRGARTYLPSHQDSAAGAVGFPVELTTRTSSASHRSKAARFSAS